MSERDITSSSDILTLAKEEDFFWGKDNDYLQSLRRYKKTLSEYNYLKHKKEQLKKDIVEFFESIDKEEYYPEKNIKQELSEKLQIDLFNTSNELEKKRKLLACLENSEEIRVILKVEAKKLWTYSDSNIFWDFADTTTMFDDIFTVYYNEMLASLKNIKTSANISAELVPFLYIIFNASLAFSKINKSDVESHTETFLRWAENNTESFSLNVFNKRIKLYSKILSKQIEPHYEWLLWNKPKNSNPISDCVGVLGDILYNVDCADNYENSPVTIGDIFDLKEFAESILSIDKKLGKFIAQIKQRITGKNDNDSDNTSNPIAILFFITAIALLAMIMIVMTIVYISN